MKHLLLLLFLVIVGYAAWSAADKKVRKVVVSDLTYHGLRLGALILLLLLVVAAAMNLPSSVLF